MRSEKLSESISQTGNAVPRSRWMVVENNDDVLDFVAYALELRGLAEVCRFRSGADALATFSAAPEQFQFVITDFDMPDMNGIELGRRLLAVAPQLKMVLISGTGDITEAVARQSGFCGLLAKPFPAAEIWRIMEAAGVLPQPTPVATP